MKRIVLVVGVFAAVASLASTDVRPQQRSLPSAPVATVQVPHSPACDGSLRMQLAMAAIATAP